MGKIEVKEKENGNSEQMFQNWKTEGVVRSHEGMTGYSTNNEPDEDQTLENAVLDAQREALRVLLRELLEAVQRRTKGHFSEEEVRDISMQISRVIEGKIRDVAMIEKVGSVDISSKEHMTTMGRRVRPALFIGATEEEKRFRQIAREQLPMIDALHHHPIHGGSEGDEDDPPAPSEKENKEFAEKIQNALSLP